MNVYSEGYEEKWLGIVMENKDKIILDLCGGTGAWSKPYEEAGYDVKVITLPYYDIRKFVFTFPPEKVYGILSAPPCTQFSYARARNKNLKYPRNLEGGMELVNICLDIIWQCQYRIKTQADKKTSLKFWALENPNGFLKYFLGKPAFVFDPWEFGDMYKKKTHLWGWFNLPIKTWFIKPNCKKFGYSKLPSISDITGSKQRDRRAITPTGFAKAFYEANK